MRLVTNPGSNRSAAAITRYDVHVTPQNIIVDGAAYDTRSEMSFETIDAWVRTAKVHPYVVGTTAAEFVGLFRELAARDREMLVVMTSRKIIGSHDAAVSAAKTLGSQRGFVDVRIRVADTGMTDVGAGLATILAGEAKRAGASLDELAALVDAFRSHARLVVLPEILGYFVKKMPTPATQNLPLTPPDPSLFPEDDSLPDSLATIPPERRRLGWLAVGCAAVIGTTVILGLFS